MACINKTVSVATLALILSASYTLAAPSLTTHNDSVPAITQATSNHQAPSYLFVVSAQQAQITPADNGQLSLNISHDDIDNVIELSDRPNRFVKYLSADRLSQDWSVGTDSFTANPPNAVLSAANMKPQVVILTNMSIQDNQVIFGLDQLNADKTLPKGKLTHPVLTIDNYYGRSKPIQWCPFNNNTVIQCSMVNQ